LLAVLVSFGLPTLLGALWDGWIGALGGFLIGGVAKVVMLQHGTFLINSACLPSGGSRIPRDAVRVTRFSWRCLPWAKVTIIIITSFSTIIVTE
jgi:fatty-acid desaturase